MLFETRLLTLLALNDALVPRLRNEQKKNREKKSVDWGKKLQVKLILTHTYLSQEGFEWQRNTLGIAFTLMHV